jgi:hypothetical protein
MRFPVWASFFPLMLATRHLSKLPTYIESFTGVSIESRRELWDSKGKYIKFHTGNSKWDPCVKCCTIYAAHFLAPVRFSVMQSNIAEVSRVYQLVFDHGLTARLIVGRWSWSNVSHICQDVEGLSSLHAIPEIYLLPLKFTPFSVLAYPCTSSNFKTIEAPRSRRTMAVN